MSRWKQVSSLVHNKTLVSSLGVSFQAVSFAHTVSCACTSPELLACWPVAVMSYYSFCSLFIYVCKRIYFFVCLFAYLAIFSFDAVSVPCYPRYAYSLHVAFYFRSTVHVKISLSLYAISFIFHSFSISFLAFTCHLLDLVFNCIHYPSSMEIWNAHHTKTC